ncbi:hypothetical protein PMAYCL1PPCAC_28617, partial [Pristionchus mayeri]
THSPVSFSSLPRLPQSSSFMGQKFFIVRTLGEGDFGIVKEVQCRKSCAKFAIKISKVDPMKVKTGLNYTTVHLKEVKSHMAVPSHTKIIEFYRAWKEGGHVYIQMELCKESLEEYWKKQIRMTECELRKALNDSLKALSYLSIHNFVHLDIKPANILRSEQGVYKLADFSVTLDLSKDSSSEEIGSGRYAAPELLGENIFSPKADLYSLAISLSQVSVPGSSPLDDEEWMELKEGKMPKRV